MGLGRGDILGKKVTIDVDGDVDFLHDRVRTFGEPAAPHLVAHDHLLIFAASVAPKGRYTQGVVAPRGPKLVAQKASCAESVAGAIGAPK
jgi:hypothetical protein